MLVVVVVVVVVVVHTNVPVKRNAAKVPHNRLHPPLRGEWRNEWWDVLCDVSIFNRKLT